MKNYIISDTYKDLYDYVIGRLLSEICQSNKNICVRSQEIPYIIGEKFDEYKIKTTKNMIGTRLDRHKLASCICGAIIEAKPLVGFNGANIRKNANEIFALYVGLYVIKYFMIYADVENQCIPNELKETFVEYLRENFDMKFPDFKEKICDEQDYLDNLVNSLYWSHQECKISNSECFRYDIWAYSKIYYHLEIYNRNSFENVLQSFKARTRCS